MLRTIENANRKNLVELLQKINNGIKSMIYNYTILYNEKELELFNKISKLFEYQKQQVENNNFNNNDIYLLLKCEDFLKPFIFRSWIYEEKNGHQYISWFKKDKLGNMPQVVSSTFGINNNVCNSRYGINYKVPINAFLGACNKDAATIITNAENSLYTIGKTSDGKTINSYNLATPIITPIQTFDKKNNQYKFKYNEVILDSRYIEPVSIIYTNNNDLEMVNKIKEKYHIPAEYQQIKKLNHDIIR